MRPLFLPRPRTYQRTSYRPGALCQFDLWAPRRKIPLGDGQTRRRYVVVACLPYSRAGAGSLVFSREAPDLLDGIARALSVAQRAALVPLPIVALVSALALTAGVIAIAVAARLVMQHSARCRTPLTTAALGIMVCAVGLAVLAWREIAIGMLALDLACTSVSHPDIFCTIHLSFGAWKDR